MENFPCKRGQLGSEAAIFSSAGISLFCLQSNKIHGTNLLEGFKKCFILYTLCIRLTLKVENEYQISEEGQPGMEALPFAMLSGVARVWGMCCLRGRRHS